MSYQTGSSSIDPVYECSLIATSTGDPNCNIIATKGGCQKQTNTQTQVKVRVLPDLWGLRKCEVWRSSYQRQRWLLNKTELTGSICNSGQHLTELPISTDVLFWPFPDISLRGLKVKRESVSLRGLKVKKRKWKWPFSWKREEATQSASSFSIRGTAYCVYHHNIRKGNMLRFVWQKNPIYVF